jgi:hypothetical protein
VWFDLTNKRINMLYKCERRPKKKYLAALSGLYIYVEADTPAEAKKIAEKSEHMRVNIAGEYCAIAVIKYVEPVHGNFGYL